MKYVLDHKHDDDVGNFCVLLALRNGYFSINNILCRSNKCAYSVESFIVMIVISLSSRHKHLFTACSELNDSMAIHSDLFDSELKTLNPRIFLRS